MSWNGEKATNFFERQYNGANPDSIKTKQVQNTFTRNLYDIELARKDFYLHCAENAWTKEKLVDFLSSSIKNGVNINSKANDNQKYLDAFVAFANELLKNLETEKINFQ